MSRVPLIVRWPNGGLAIDRTLTAMAEAVDVLPTVLDCAGIQISPHVQGHSLLPVLKATTESARDSALMEATGWKNLRTRQYRYLIHDDGREMLWDIENDPGEYQDVAGEKDYADVLAEHRNLLLQRLLSMERPLPRIWPY